MLRRFLVFFVTTAMFFACNSGGNKDGGTVAEGKKVFRYNQAGGLSSLDPAFARTQANIWATAQIFGGLFELNKDLYPIPNLVESWSISEGGLVYTFKLKEGIKFHDNDVFEDGIGREVKASDFEYSFKRILNPKTASTGQWIFNNKVKRTDAGEIATDWVRAIDDYTLEINLEEPFGPFLEILTMPYTYVVPQEAIKEFGKDFRTNPIGTGPFAFKSWDENSSLILLKNEAYWRKDEDGNQLPYLDAVQVSFITDKNQELLTFKQKKLDFVSGNQPSSVDQILNKDGSIKEEASKAFSVHKEPFLNTEYIGFLLDPSKYEDKDHPIFNKKFRQALSYAINREELVSFLLNNLGTPGTAGIIPPAISAYDAQEVKGYSYDAKKAEELLKESGFGTGGKSIPAIKLYTTLQSKAWVEFLQKQWDAIGVKVEIEINQVATHQELVDNARANFFRGSWLGDYPDAENYLSMFYSKNFSPAGPNKTHFKNERFDELYEKAKLETEGFKRFDLYTEMDKIIIAEAPVIILFYDEVLRLTQHNVTGLEPDPMNTLKLERADIKDTKEVKEGSL